MLPFAKAFSLLVILAILSGCGTTQRGAGGNMVGHTETGVASFYADRYQNQKTASGERYKARQKTAAHRTLPFGSQVRVTNIRNGKSVVVRINDRGPFVRGRIIDLSRSAFSSIGDTSAGLLDVRIEVIR